jgi:hypothetical protein
MRNLKEIMQNMKDLCQLYKIVERGVKDLKRKKSQMILIKNKYKLKL